MIVPNARFNCNGRITNVAVSQFQALILSDSSFPLFQVWHPNLPNSTTYNKIAEVQLPLGDFRVVAPGRNYHHVNLSLNSSSQIEFQSGDVIGYYQPPNSQRLIGSIQTSGYTSYSNSVTSPSTSIDINNVDNIDTDHQPLIAVMFGNIAILFICTWLCIQLAIYTVTYILKTCIAQLYSQPMATSLIMLFMYIVQVLSLYASYISSYSYIKQAMCVTLLLAN